VIHYIIIASVCALGLSYLAIIHYCWLRHEETPLDARSKSSRAGQRKTSASISMLSQTRMHAGLGR
jgi:hypothetical protein